MKPVFAVDVGGVLASLKHDGVPQVGSIGALKYLLPRYEVWVVSQCGFKRARDTAVWLEERGFDIPKARQIYVPFEEHKWPHLKRLGAVYFVDDRIKHVDPAVHYVPSLERAFLFGKPPDLKFATPKILAVPNWANLLERIP